MSETSGKGWCSHILFFACGWQYETGRGSLIDVADWILCPICKKSRPEERDELDEIFDKYKGNLINTNNWPNFKKDLRAWKLKNTIPVSSDEYPARMVEEEKPKRLWEILDHTYSSSSYEDDWKERAKAALDWFEGILPPKQSGVDSNKDWAEGWDHCLAKIRQRIERERSQ